MKLKAWEINEKRWLDKDELFISVLTGELSGWQKDCNWEIVQSTGSFDKNGKEIWVGDILHEFREKTAPMANNGIDRKFVAGGGFCDVYTGYLEVIGNKFEHPHLLNKENTNT